MKRRKFLARTLGLASGAVGVAAAGAAGVSMASPAPGHRVLDLELFDTARQRPVPARLYLPLMASPNMPVPLVVFSHGLGGSRLGYSYLGRHWADAGIASLHPQHVGSDSAVWRGNPLEVLQRLQTAARDVEALARALDLRFAMNEVLASNQGGLINTSRMAVAGHSYGANTAMLIAGARVDTDGAHPGELRDGRIRAAILISAPPLLGQGPAQQVLGNVSMPTLHITSLDDTINLPGYRSTVEDRIAIFDAMARSPRTLAVYNTGGHSIFTDRTTRSGPLTSARIKSATQELCTLFLHQSLQKGQDTPSAFRADMQGTHEWPQWRERHQDLLHKFIVPDNVLHSGLARARGQDGRSCVCTDEL